MPEDSDDWSSETDVDHLPLESKRKDEPNRDWHQEVESLRRHNAFLTQERDAQETAIANQNSQLQAALEEAATAKEKIQHEKFKLQALMGDIEKLKRESQHSETHLMRHTQQLEAELERYRIDNLQASEIQKNLESKVKDLSAAKDALSKYMDLPTDELRQENIRLEEELRTRVLKLDEQQQELGRFQMNKDIAEKALVDLENAKYSADQERTQMEQQIAELQASTAEISRQKNTLQHKHDTMEAGKASLNQENIRLKACVDDLQNAKNSLNHKYDTMKAGKPSLDQEIVNLKACVEDLRNAEDSLQHRYDTMKAGKASVDRENIELKACVEELRNSKNSLSHEKAQMAKEIASHRLDKRNLEKAFETLKHDSKAKFEQTKNALEAEKAHAGREKTSLSNKLLAANDENLMLKNSLQTMKSHQARVDHQGNDLRSRLELANNKIHSLEHQNSELSSKIVSLNANHHQKDRAFTALQGNKARLDGEKQSLSERVVTLNRTLEAVKAQSQQATDALRREMEEQRRQSAARVKEAARAVGGHHTPRTVIFQKILSQARTSQDISEIPGASRFMELCTLSSLTNQYLDLPLSTKNAHKLGKSIRGNEMAIVGCNVCQLPKLTLTNQAPRLRVDELGQKMQCCSAKICKSCVLEGAIRSLLHDYWFDLEKSVWVKCPSGNCDASFNIRGRDQLQATLQNLGDPNVAKHIAAYDRIKTLRDALKGLSPKGLDGQGLKVSSELYFQLISMGRMHNIADLPPNSILAREDMPSFEPAETELISVEHQGVTLKVAFLFGFIRKKRIPKECAYCVEKIYDIEIDVGRIWNWVEDCSGFNGDWMWEVLKFPLKLATECKHDINFCTKCLEKHLKVQLKEYGRAKCQDLSCPFPECRRLTYQEVKLYAKSNTFAT
ncbi:unnamed protein product, partial [Clonostachys rhizophaga]